MVVAAVVEPFVKYLPQLLVKTLSAQGKMDSNFWKNPLYWEAQAGGAVLTREDFQGKMRNLPQLMREVQRRLEPEPVDTSTWEGEGGACLPELPEPEPIPEDLKKHWTKCCFCGASNGLFGSKLEQHRPRCRWMGDADKFNAMHPNYSKMIAEDDPRHLSMMQAKSELDATKLELQKLKNKEAHG